MEDKPKKKRTRKTTTKKAEEVVEKSTEEKVSEPVDEKPEVFEKKPEKKESLEVTVLKKGFIYGQIRQPREHLTLKDKKDFSEKWMAWGKVEVPEPKITHAKIRQHQPKPQAAEYAKTYAKDSFLSDK